MTTSIERLLHATTLRGLVRAQVADALVFNQLFAVMTKKRRSISEMNCIEYMSCTDAVGG